MSRRHYVRMRAVAMAAMLGLGTMATAGPVQSPGAGAWALPVDARVGELDQAALVAAWWQWTMSLPMEPYMDRDGRWCDVGQRDDVWFLAGTDGSFDAQRRCQVPMGTPLFLPVVNYYFVTPLAAKLEETIPGCPELQRGAAMPPEGLLRAKVTLDGVPLDDVAGHRVSSAGCFDPYPDSPPLPGRHLPLAASDGYWLLIPPLLPGTHVLAIDAHYRFADGERGELVQRFEYTLQVGETQKYVSR